MWENSSDPEFYHTAYWCCSFLYSLSPPTFLLLPPSAFPLARHHSSSFVPPHPPVSFFFPSSHHELSSALLVSAPVPLPRGHCSSVSIKLKTHRTTKSSSSSARNSQKASRSRGKSRLPRRLTHSLTHSLFILLTDGFQVLLERLRRKTRRHGGCRGERRERWEGGRVAG